MSRTEIKSFKWLIVDPFDGCVKGTNDEITAKIYMACEDFHVIDLATCAVVTISPPEAENEAGVCNFFPIQEVICEP